MTRYIGVKIFCQLGDKTMSNKLYSRELSSGEHLFEHLDG